MDNELLVVMVEQVRECGGHEEVVAIECAHPCDRHTLAPRVNDIAAGGNRHARKGVGSGGGET